MQMIRTLRRMLAGCVVALAAAPSAHAADMAPDPKATLIYFDAVSNQTLDPQEPQNDSSFAQGPLMAIYDSLIYLTEAGEPKPGLAESFSYNADLTEFTLTLRQGVTFHDGAKLDSAAVARNFERSAALGTRAGFATSETMSHVAAVELPDARTVRLKLKAPNGQLPYFLGSQAGMMVSPASLTGDAFGA